VEGAKLGLTGLPRGSGGYAHDAQARGKRPGNGDLREPAAGEKREVMIVKEVKEVVRNYNGVATRFGVGRRVPAGEANRALTRPARP
jgi:hypothetical protein